MMPDTEPTGLNHVPLLLFQCGYSVYRGRDAGRHSTGGH
jgi:hypothetical protein